MSKPDLLSTLEQIHEQVEKTLKSNPAMKALCNIVYEHVAGDLELVDEDGKPEIFKQSRLAHRFDKYVHQSALALIQTDFSPEEFLKFEREIFEDELKGAYETPDRARKVLMDTTDAAIAEAVAQAKKQGMVR